MKYIKSFENHSAYEEAESGLILPNVSLCKQENEVHYNPYVEPAPPIIDGHEYVDLGLPSGTLWAKYNIGATSETEYGNYYQYGKGSSTYQETSGGSTYYGTEDPLAASKDAAVQTWGGEWHTPTRTQFNELTANTTFELVTINGVNGGKFTSANGNYVFFSSAGYYYKGSGRSIGIYGTYWTSSPYPDSYNDARTFTISTSGNPGVGYNPRTNGYPVRPVVG